MQTRTVVFGVGFVPRVFSHFVIGVVFVVVVGTNAYYSVFIENKSSVKTAASLFTAPQPQRYFDTFFQSLVHLCNLTYKRHKSMAKFIKYTDVPVFANFSSPDQAPITGGAGSDLMAANDVTINFEASLEPRKYLGKTPISNDYAPTGPLQAKISFSWFPLIGENTNSRLISQTGVLALTGEFETGHQIRVGNFLFKDCHLNSYTIQITPYQPIVFSADFNSYDTETIEGTSFTGLAGAPALLQAAGTGAYFDSLHALAVGITGNLEPLPQSKKSVQINTSCGRNAVYSIGSKTPDRVLLNSVERTVTIEGENVGAIIDYNGSGDGSSVSFRFSPFRYFVTGTSFNPRTDYKLAIDVSGKITSQSLTQQPGNTLNGSVSLKENIY